MFQKQIFLNKKGMLTKQIKEELSSRKYIDIITKLELYVLDFIIINTLKNNQILNYFLK